MSVHKRCPTVTRGEKPARLAACYWSSADQGAKRFGRRQTMK
jgi:hypothetical protein